MAMLGRMHYHSLSRKRRCERLPSAWRTGRQALNRNDMKKNSKTIETTVQESNRLLRDLQEIVEQAETMLKDAASNKAGETLATLRERLEDSQERLGKLYSNARTQCVDSAKRVDTNVRDNPYQSLAIVAGAALIVGFLARRKAR